MSGTPKATSCSSCGQLYAADGLFCPACGTPRSRDASGDPLMGAILGERFLLVDRIGHGASGTIYRGEHVTLRRKVAVKVLHHELCRDELAVERFRREATTVSEIDNDHIVEIHDFGRTPDGRLYLAMELLEGETLQDRLRREKRLPVKAAVDVLIQLGEALMEAHAMGYVHRDLRPRNIYLCERRGRANFVKLLDFGLAKLVEGDGNAESTSLGMTFGDPRYMSPEQARGDVLDRRADIYSLGCIAYEMLAGQAPFASGKAFDIVAGHVDATPTDLRERRTDVPPWLNTAIMRMLAKRPDDRFTTVYRVVEALRQGLETGQTMSAEVARKEAHGPEQAGLGAAAQAEPELANRTIKIGLAAMESREPVSMPGSAAGRMEGSARQPLEEEAATQPVAIEIPAAHDPSPASVDEEAASPETAAPGRTDSRDDEDDAGDEGDMGEVAPAATPAGTASRSADDSMSGLSGAWFADGEGADGDVDEDMRAQLDKARSRISLDDTSLIGDELYYDPNRKPVAKIAAVAGGVILLIIVIAAVAWPSGDKPAQTGDTPAQTIDSSAAELPSAASTLAQLDHADAAPVPADAGVVDAAAQTAQTDTPPAPAPKASTTEKQPRPRRTPVERTPRVREPREPVDELRDPFSETTTPAPGADSTAAKQASFFAKLGQSALRDGNIGSAADNFKKALDLDARNVDAVVGQGEIALRTGSSQAAILHLTRAARMSPRNAHVHTLLGEAYLHAGNDSKAAQSFKQALRLNPDNARARNGYNDAAGRIPPPPEDD